MLNGQTQDSDIYVLHIKALIYTWTNLAIMIADNGKLPFFSIVDNVVVRVFNHLQLRLEHIYIESHCKLSSTNNNIEMIFCMKYLQDKC